MLGILTYRRVNVLRTMMAGLDRHCAAYPTVISEDCGQFGATEDYLQSGRRAFLRRDLLAYEYSVGAGRGPSLVRPEVRVFMGERNLGVAGNSNRLLRLFEESDCDHLCLCNDDLLVEGDFVEFYAKAHQELGVQFFAFCDFTHHESYRWTTYRVRGYSVKFLPRMTGIMLSLTREVLNKVGYFDAQFGTFGEEHCDYNHRARMAGCIRLQNQDMHCLDVEGSPIRHQECPTSVQGQARQLADRVASMVMQQACAAYAWRHPYRPFQLVLPKVAGAYNHAGIPVDSLLGSGYQLVQALA